VRVADTKGSAASVRVRFAPSPTGSLHVGSARTALFNWLFARHVGGTYLLRIEDTDTERNRQDWAEGIVTTLDWLGLAPDEPPVSQSQFVEEHHQAATALYEAGYLYACDCTSDQVKARAEKGAPPGYDGFCRNRRLPREGNALRFRVPDEGTVVVPDMIHGDVEFPLRSMEDFVVVKSNGAPLFVLANVVDDRRMAISHVIRGDDLLPSTPKGLLLWKALDEIPTPAGGKLSLPAYAHLPMLVDERREKISKRREGTAVEYYRSEGYLPGAFDNYLSLLGWAHPDGIEIFDIEEAARVFEIETVHHAPAFFDMAKLRHVNSEYLRGLSGDDFIRVSMPWMMVQAEVLENHIFEAITPGGPPWPSEHFDPDVFARIAPHVQERVATLREVPPMVDFLFFDQPVLNKDDWDAVVRDEGSKAIIDAAIAAYSECSFEPEELHRVTAEVAESVGRKLAKAQAPIRVSITGKRVGPPLFESLAILGREKVLERLRSARSRLDSGD
jgi:glutamyl-tRNA synthetase